MIVRTVRIRPRRVAAPARELTAEQAAEREAARRLPPHVDDMLRDWGAWIATRRIAAPPPIGSILGRLRTAAAAGGDGPRMRLDQHVAAFHAAMLGQDARGFAVCYGMYALPYMGTRVPLKRLADAVGVSRQHAYRLRDEAANRAYRAREQFIAQAMEPTRTQDVYAVD